MDAKEIIVGRYYEIVSVDEDYKPWFGVAKYVGPAGPDYDDGVLEFECKDDGIPGMFLPQEVLREVIADDHEAILALLSAVDKMQLSSGFRYITNMERVLELKKQGFVVTRNI